MQFLAERQVWWAAVAALTAFLVWRWVAEFRSRTIRQTPKRVWGGALCGAVVAWLLAVTGVTVTVPSCLDEEERLRYRVRVLGAQVYRYPEDGEVFPMRPVPQMDAWRDCLAFGFALVGAAGGGAAALAFRRRTRRCT